MSKPLHVLIVEDSGDDAELILLELRRYGFHPLHERVDTSLDTENALLRQNWDIVVSDYSMPGFNGLDALKLVRQKDPDMPFILVSGAIGEELAAFAMKSGAQDYLMKGNLTRLAPAVDREVQEAEVRREKKRTARLLQAIVEFSGDPIISKSLDGIVTSWNQAAQELFGYSAEEMIGQSIRQIIPAERIQEENGVFELLKAGHPIENYETVRMARTGRLVPVSVSISPLRDGAGKIIGASTIIRDITERKETEARLAAWQRELEERVVERTAELTRTHQELQAATEQRRRLEAEIARASEREQLRLGQELHDGLGQQLTGISYLLAALQDKLRRNSVEAKEAARLQVLVKQGVLQTKHLAKGFYPVDLERLGLLVALEEIAQSSTGPSSTLCVVESDGNPIYANLKGPLAIQLFRIAQESLHNALKYAAAKSIVIRLATVNSRILLTIKDDGIGFPPDVEESKGMGLRIMQYRAETVGGELSARNNSSGGVTVTCSVPFDAWDRSPVVREETGGKPGESNRKRQSAGKAHIHTV